MQNVEGPCGYRTRGVSIRGKWNSFYRQTWVQDEWGRRDAKRNTDRRQVYPKVKLQERDLVRFVGFVAPFAPLGAGTRGKFVLSSPRGKMGTGDVCLVRQRYATGEPGKLQSRDYVGIVEGSFG